MKAVSDYTATPGELNEISFYKGEILEILEDSGRWYNVKKLDGRTGLVPW